MYNASRIFEHPIPEADKNQIDENQIQDNQIAACFRSNIVNERLDKQVDDEIDAHQLNETENQNEDELVSNEIKNKKIMKQLYVKILSTIVFISLNR